MTAPINERSVLVMTNNDNTVQPLIIFMPQWSKASLDRMPKQRQLQVYDDFSSAVADAWDKLLREV